MYDICKAYNTYNITKLIMLYHYYTSIKSKKYEIVLKKENECVQGI